MKTKRRKKYNKKSYRKKFRKKTFNKKYLKKGGAPPSDKMIEQSAKLLNIEDIETMNKQQIINNFKIMALIYHPDHNHGNEVQAAEDFKEINKAKEILIEYLENKQTRQYRPSHTRHYGPSWYRKLKLKNIVILDLSRKDYTIEQLFDQLLNVMKTCPYNILLKRDIQKLYRFIYLVDNIPFFDYQDNKNNETIVSLISLIRLINRLNIHRKNLIKLEKLINDIKVHVDNTLAYLTKQETQLTDIADHINKIKENTKYIYNLIKTEIQTKYEMINTLIQEKEIKMKKEKEAKRAKAERAKAERAKSRQASIVHLFPPTQQPPPPSTLPPSSTSKYTIRI